MVVEPMVEVMVLPPVVSTVTIAEVVIADEAPYSKSAMFQSLSEDISYSSSTSSSGCGSSTSSDGGRGSISGGRNSI